MRPIVFDLDKSAGKLKFNQLKKRNTNLRFINSDIFFEEVVKIRNPHIQDDIQLGKLEKEIREKIGNGLAAYLPWRNAVCFVPSKKIFWELTTARNKHLIRSDEQNKLRKTAVAFFGLSVGSQAALTWMLESRADSIKIVDPDIIGVSNLNRIRFGIDAIGRSKVNVTSEGLYEINPFSRVYKYRSSKVNAIEKIICSRPAADIIVDEIDDMEAKVMLRKMAKKYKLPLVSAADVGDNVLVDIERYDHTPQPSFFLDRIPGIEKMNISKLSEGEQKKLIIKLVGFEADANRIPDSIMAIGGSLRTWPQLGATATMAGGVVTTALKKIILGENVLSGRYYISLDEILDSDYHSEDMVRLREMKVKKVTDLLEKY